VKTYILRFLYFSLVINNIVGVFVKTGAALLFKVCQ